MTSPSTYNSTSGTLNKSSTVLSASGSVVGRDVELVFPEISKDEIEFIKNLGSGASGKVYQGKCRGHIVAVKEISGLNDDKIEKLKTEVAIMSQLRHPNVVLFMGACLQPGLIVTEYVSCGDLEGQLVKMSQKQVEVSQLQLLSWARDISAGMHWLHCCRPPIIHKDLKPANILLDEHNRCKICDFGLSVLQETRDLVAKSWAGSMAWMAPEMFSTGNYNEKVDVYAYGLILWQLFAGQQFPYELHKYKDNPYQFIKDVSELKKRPRIPPNLDNSIEKIIEKCWDHDPTVRPNFSEIHQQISDAAITTTLLRDFDAINLWKSKWSGQTEIPLQQFLPEIYNVLKVALPPVGAHANPADLGDPVTRRKCLEAIIAPAGKKVVTLERFGLLLTWFGPLIPVDNSCMLDKIHDTLREPWFHGDITREDSERFMSGHPRSGSFLIRTSEKSQYPFTLSRVFRDKSKDQNTKQSKSKQKHPRKTEHLRIGYNDGIFSLQVKVEDKVRTFTNKSLVALLLDRKLTKVLRLKFPIDRNKYNDIFIVMDHTGYSYAWQNQGDNSDDNSE